MLVEIGGKQLIRRKGQLFALLLLSVIWGSCTFFAWNNRLLFVGDSTKTSECYILDFEEMNQMDCHVLTLRENEVLSVEYSIYKGRVDFSVEAGSDTSVFKGNNIDSGKFELIIPSDGEYEIVVNAKHASGVVEIKKQ